MYHSNTYKEDLAFQYNRIDFSKLKNKKILITGANGLICSYLIDLLLYANKYYNTNITIYALSRNLEKLQKRFLNYLDNINLIPVIQDATDKLEIDIVDYVIAGASPAVPNLYITEPISTMDSNYIGIHNVLEYAKNKKVKVIYISSSDVYGVVNDNIEYCTENDYGYVDILNVRSSYVSSKRAAETLCISYREKYDVDVKIVRPAHIYGPTMTNNDTRAVSSFIQNVISDNDIIMKSDGSSIRSYCYVGDTVIGILTVLLDGVSGEAYNISNNSNIISIKDLANKIAKLGNKKLIIELSDDYVSKKIDSNVKIIKMNNDKLKALGWDSLINIDDGLKRTIKIIKEMD